MCIKIEKMKCLKIYSILLLLTIQIVQSQETVINKVVIIQKIDSLEQLLKNDSVSSLVAEENKINRKFHEIKEETKAIKKKNSTLNQLTTILSIALITILLLLTLSLFKQQRDKLKMTNELIVYKQKALYLQMNPHFIFNSLGALSGFVINKETDLGVKYLAKFSKLMRLTLEYSQESLISLEKEIESLENYLELEKLRFDNKFDFTITKSQNIEDDIAVPPLLIQPLIENAINHGLIPQNKKGKIDICFALDEDNIIVCEILDNGVGINKSIENKKTSVNIHKSMALGIIKQRLSIIAKKTKKNARLETYQINDKAKQSMGTKVIVILPIQYKS